MTSSSELWSKKAVSKAAETRQKGDKRAAKPVESRCICKSMSRLVSMLVPLTIRKDPPEVISAMTSTTGYDWFSVSHV